MIKQMCHFMIYITDKTKQLERNFTDGNDQSTGMEKRPASI